MTINYKSFSRLGDGGYIKGFIFDGVDYFQASFKLKEQVNCKICGELLDEVERDPNFSTLDFDETHWMKHKELLTELGSNGDKQFTPGTSYIEEGYILNGDVFDLDESSIENYEKYLMHPKRYKYINRIIILIMAIMVISVVVGVALTPPIQWLFTDVKNYFDAPHHGGYIGENYSYVSYEDSSFYFAKPFLETVGFVIFGIIIFLKVSRILSKIYDKICKPIKKSNMDITNQYRASYNFGETTIVGRSELADIKDALNKTIEEGDSIKFQKIMENLKESERAATIQNKKLNSNKLNEINKVIDDMNKKDRKRIYNNKVLKGTYTYNEIDDALTSLNLQNKALYKNFGRSDVKTMITVKESLKKYENNINILNTVDKNRYQNCREEFLSNYAKVEELLESEVKLTEDFKRDFMKLSRVCLRLLNNVEDNLLEGSSTDVKVSTMFLEDKYKHLMRK